VEGGGPRALSPSGGGAPGGRYGNNGPCVRARCREGRTFGMHLDDSAQRTNFTCPRDFGGLLRPVARLFLVMTGELGLLQTGDEDTRSAAPPKADPRTTEDYQGHFFIHTRRGRRGGKVDCFYKGQTYRTQ
jgi:hypothetical protein